MHRVIICSDTHVHFIRPESEPEDFAGFVGDDIRIYIPVTAYKKISIESLEVLRAYPYVKAVDVREYQ